MLFINKGKDKAFEELYKRYSKRMLYFFYQKLYGDNEKAQDFLQDLFLKIIEKPHLFDPGKRFIVWIYTMASNMCKNEYRRNAVRGTREDNFDFSEIAEVQPASNLADKFDRNLFACNLSKELDRLDENQRITFILRYKENLSINDISEIMECSEGTVKSRLFYTTRKLSARLKIFDPHKAIK